MRHAQHLPYIKYIYFQNSAEPRASETLKLFHEGKWNKARDDFAAKICSILGLTIIFKLLWPPPKPEHRSQI